MQQQGDVPLLGSDTAGVSLEEARKGQLQYSPGRSPFGLTVSGLNDTERYYFRVASYNILGHGSFSLAKARWHEQPSTAHSPATTWPDAPRGALFTQVDSSRANLTVRLPPLTSGGGGIAAYVLSLDPQPTFTSAADCGSRTEKQLIQVSMSSPPSGQVDQLKLEFPFHGYVVETQCLSLSLDTWTGFETALENELASTNPFVTVDVTIVGDSSAETEYGRSIVLEFAEHSLPFADIPQARVMTCSGSFSASYVSSTIQDGRGDGTNSVGSCEAQFLAPIKQEIFSGNSFVVSGLVPGVPMFGKLHAVNSAGLQGPAFYLSDPLVLKAPPLPPAGAEVTPLSEHSLFVDVTPSLGSTSLGNEGSTIHSYTVFAAGASIEEAEVQHVTVDVDADTLSAGELRLVADGYYTECLPLPLSGSDVEVELALLPMIKRVAVVDQANGTLHVEVTESGDVPQLGFSTAGCQPVSPPSSLQGKEVVTINNGYSLPKPTILRVATESSFPIAGNVNVLGGFHGTLDEQVCPACASLDLGEDPRFVLLTGFPLAIAELAVGQRVRVDGVEHTIASLTVHEQGIRLSTAQPHPRSFFGEPLFVDETYVGIGRLNETDSTMLQTRRDLSSRLRGPGATIKVGDHVHTVMSVSGHVVMVAEPILGQRSANIPLFVRDEVQIPFDATEQVIVAHMAQLAGAGRVNVQTWGPGANGAMVWELEMRSTRPGDAVSPQLQVSAVDAAGVVTLEAPAGSGNAAGLVSWTQQGGTWGEIRPSSSLATTRSAVEVQRVSVLTRGSLPASMQFALIDWDTPANEVQIDIDSSPEHVQSLLHEHLRVLGRVSVSSEPLPAGFNGAVWQVTFWSNQASLPLLGLGPIQCPEEAAHVTCPIASDMSEFTVNKVHVGAAAGTRATLSGLSQGESAIVFVSAQSSAGTSSTTLTKSGSGNVLALWTDVGEQPPSVKNVQVRSVSATEAEVAFDGVGEKFDASTYILEVSTTDGVEEVQSITVAHPDGVSGTFQLKLASEVTVPLRHNASEVEVAAALKQMKAISRATVHRQSLDSNLDGAVDGYKWILRMRSSDVHQTPDLPDLVVVSSLSPASAGINSCPSQCVDGSPPADYAALRLSSRSSNQRHECAAFADGLFSGPCMAGESTVFTIMSSVADDDRSSYGGSFVLSYGGKETRLLSATASAADVQAQLADVIGNDFSVEVDRYEYTQTGAPEVHQQQWGIKWHARITPSGAIDVEDLSVLTHSFTGEDAAIAVFRSIFVETSTARGPLNGAFVVRAQHEQTAPLSVDASAEAVQEEMEALLGVGKVHVDRTLSYRASGARVVGRPGDGFVRSSMDVSSSAFPVSQGSRLLIAGDEFSVCHDGVAAVNLDAQAIPLCEAANPNVQATFSGPGSAPLDLLVHANGYQWCITLMVSVHNVQDFFAIPGPGFAGVGSVLRTSTGAGLRPFTVHVGQPSPVHTIVLKDPFFNTATSASYPDVGFRLEFDGRQTECLRWHSDDGEALSSKLTAAIQDVGGEPHVQAHAVKRGSGLEPDFFGYTITVSYSGAAESLVSIPQLSVTTAGCTDPAYPGTVLADEAVLHSRSLPWRETFLSLEPGREYQVRVSAENSFGIGEPSDAVHFTTPNLAQTPGAVQAVNLVDLHTGDGVEVFFKAPREDGGDPILKYSVEIDTLPTFTGTAYRKVDVASVPEEQEVTLNFASDSSRGGFFVLGLGIKRTDRLPWNAHARQIANSLARALGAYSQAYEPIEVNRAPYENGFKWFITFNGLSGDVGTLQADSSGLLGVKPTVTTNEVLKGRADIVPGSFSFEEQLISIEALSPLSGTFTLDFEDEQTEPISVGASAADLAAALDGLSSIHTVSVSAVPALAYSEFGAHPSHPAATHSEVASPARASAWMVTFTHMVHERYQGAGNIGMLRMNASLTLGTALRASVTEFKRGTEPLRLVLSGLSAGVSYFARVTAYNSRGHGLPSSVVSETPTSQPGPPEHVSVAVSNADSLDISWKAPQSFGGEPLSSFSVQWYAEPPVRPVQTVSVSASSGVPDVQHIQTLADADDIQGAFRVVMGNSTSEDIPHDASAAQVKQALLRMPSVNAVEVSRAPSWIRIPGTFRLEQGESSVTVSDGGTAALLPLQLTPGTDLRVGTAEQFTEPADLPAFRVCSSCGAPTTAGFTLADARLSGSSTAATWEGETFEYYVLYKPGHGYVWSVTFSETGHVGRQERLVAEPGTGFIGTNVALQTRSKRAGESALSGGFRLSKGGATTAPIPHDATAEQVKSALTALPTVSTVDVSRIQNGHGFDWIVTFTSDIGPLPVMTMHDASLLGPDARGYVTMTRQGSAPGGYGHREVPVQMSQPDRTYSYTATGLQTGLRYTVQVAAANAHNGLGAATEITESTQETPRTAPGAPSVVGLYVLSDSSLKLVWSYPDDGGAICSRYEVQWSKSSSFSGGLGQVGSLIYEDHAVSLPVTSRQFFQNLALLDAGVQYYVRVRAQNDMGFGAWSAIVSAMPGVQRPGAPLNLTVTVISGVQLLVAWEPPSQDLLVYGGNGGLPVERYLIEWDSPLFSLVASPAAGSFELEDGSATSYIIGHRDSITGYEDGTLERGQQYSVRVAAWSAAGYGDYGMPATGPVTLTDQPPSVIREMRVQAVGQSSLTSAWALPRFDGGRTLQSVVVETDSSEGFGAPRQDEIPFVFEKQAVTLKSSTSVEVQHVDVLVDVTNEVQTITSTVHGADEVQTIAFESRPVVAHVDTVTTSTVDVNEVQRITAGGIAAPEEQVITTTTPNAGNPVREVQVIKTSSVDIDEVHFIELWDDNAETQASQTVHVLSASHATTPAGLDAQTFTINCGLTAADKVTFEMDTDSSYVHGSTASYVHVTITNLTTHGIAWELSSALSLHYASAPSNQGAILPPGLAGNVLTVTCRDAREAGPVDDVAIANVFSSLGSHSRGSDDRHLDRNVTFSLSVDLSRCTLCTCSPLCYVGGAQAHADMSGAEMQTVLDSLSPLTGQVTVTREDNGTNANYRRWHVTFDGAAVNGDIPSATNSRQNAVHMHDAVLANADGFSGGDATRWGAVSEGNEINAGRFVVSYTDFYTGVTESLSVGGVLHDAPGSALEGALSLQERLQTLSKINAVSVSRSVPDAAGGYEWTITFSGNDGDLHALEVHSMSADPLGTSTGALVSVEVCPNSTACRNGEFIDPASTWTISIPGFTSSMAPLRANATQLEVAAYIHGMQDVNGAPHPAVNVGRPVQVPPYGMGWTGGFEFRVQFVGIPGDIPEVLVNDSGLHGVPEREGHLHRSASASVHTEAHGNTVQGWFKLQHRGSVTPAIDLLAGVSPSAPRQWPDPTAVATQIKAALESLSSIDEVTVSVDETVHGTGPYSPNAVGGFSWLVTFTDSLNGGNVEQLTVAMACDGTTSPAAPGTLACLQLRSPRSGGEVSLDLDTAVEGNQLDGSFKLSIGGFTTGELAYDVSAAELEAALELLHSTGPITVTRHLPSGVPSVQENEKQEFVWKITFSSDTHTGVDSASDWASGYSKSWGKNIGRSLTPLLSCDASTLEDSNKDVSSHACVTGVDEPGVSPVNGFFRLRLDTLTSCAAPGSPYACTDEETGDIRHDAQASRADAAALGLDPETSVEAALEALSNVGDVAVTRRAASSPFTGAYEWSVTFLRDGSSPMCFEGVPAACPSPGDVPLLSIANAGAGLPILSAEGDPSFNTTVSETTKGNVIAGNWSVRTASGYALPLLSFDVTADTLRQRLAESPDHPTLLVSRQRTSKFRTYQWRVTFVENQGFIPTGAGDIPNMLMNASLLTDGDGVSGSANMHVAQAVQGSEPLGGRFSVDMMGSNTGPRDVVFSISESRLELELESLNNVVDVAVRSNRSFGAGWAGQHVAPHGQPGGLRFTVSFLKNAGTTEGFTFPPGSGNRDALTPSFSGLSGTNCRVVVSTHQDGAEPLHGTFSLSVASQAVTLPYDASQTSVATALSSLTSTGQVSSSRHLYYGSLLGNVHIQSPGAAVLEGERGVDFASILAVGDKIRVGGPPLQASSADGEVWLGKAITVGGSPVLTMVEGFRQHLFVGATLRIGTLVANVTDLLAAEQTIQVVSPNLPLDSDPGAFKLVYVRPSGELRSSACLSLAASAAEMRNALSSLVSDPHVHVTRAGNGSAGVGFSWTVTFKGLNDVASVRNTFNGSPSVVTVDVHNDAGVSASVECPAAAAGDLIFSSSMIKNGSAAEVTLSAPAASSSTSPVEVFYQAEVFSVVSATKEQQEVWMSAGSSGSFGLSVGASSTGCFNASIDESQALEVALRSMGLDAMVAFTRHRGTLETVYRIAFSAPGDQVDMTLDMSCSFTGEARISVPQQGTSGEVFEHHAANGTSLIPIHKGTLSPVGLYPVYKVNGWTHVVHFETHLGDVEGMGATSQLEGSGASVQVHDDFIKGFAPLSFTTQPLLSGIDYHVRASAKSAIGVSAWSATATGMPSAPPSEPTSLVVAPLTRVYEVQSVTTAARHLDEVQSIRTRAAEVPARQAIVTSAPDSGTLSGVVLVSLEGESMTFAHNASAAEVKQVLEAFSAVNRVSVTRNGQTAEGGFQWTVEFHNTSLPDPLPLMGCNASHLHSSVGEARCISRMERPKNVLGGTFYLRLGHHSTANLAHSASAGDVRRAVEALLNPQEAGVAVSKLGPDAQGGCEWRVTFKALKGDVPELVPVSSLTGVRAEVTVAEVQKGNQLEGHFTLSFGGRTTDALPFDVSATALQTALNMLPSVDFVSVQRNVLQDEQDGCTWQVTFMQKGDLPLLGSSAAGLTGEGAAVLVQEQRKGAIESGSALSVSFSPPVNTGGRAVTAYTVEWDTTPTFSSPDAGSMHVAEADLLHQYQSVTLSADAASYSGTFQLQYNGSTTEPLPFWADSAEVRDALEALPSIHAVAVDTDDGKTPVGTGSLDASPAESVLLAHDLAAQFSVGDLIWVGHEKLRVRASSSAGALTRVYFGTYNDHTVVDYAESPATEYTIFASTNGSAYAVHFLSVVGPFQPLHVPMPQAAGAVVLGAVSGRACDGCLHIRPLAKGVAHYVRVVAHNAAGRGQSTLAVVDVPRQVPAAPAAVQAVVASHESVLVRWQPPVDDGGGAIDRYLIEWDPLATFSSTPANSPAGQALVEADSLGAPPFSFSIHAWNSNGSLRSLVNGTTVFVRVAAVNDVPVDSNAMWGSMDSSIQVVDNRVWGYSSPSHVTTTYQAPSAPSSVTLLALSGSICRVSWALPDLDGGRPVTAYTVALDSVPSFDSPLNNESRIFDVAHLKALSPGGEVQVDLTGLESGRVYFARVRGENAEGPGAWSAATGGVVPIAPPGQSATTQASTILQSDEPVSFIDVTWSPPAHTNGAEVTGYLVEWFTKKEVPTVQRVFLSSPKGRSDIDTVSGTFMLLFKGESTVQMPQDVSAADMRRHLMHLQNSSTGSYLIPDVRVTRDETPSGYSWEIAFVGMPGAVPQLRADSSNLVSVSRCDGAGTNACLDLRVDEDEYLQGRREGGSPQVQVLTFLQDEASNSAPHGFVTLSVAGSLPTPPLDISSPAAYIAEALGNLPTVRQVHVTTTPVSTSCSLAHGCEDGLQMQVTFLPAGVAVPPIVLDASNLQGGESLVASVHSDGVDVGADSRELCELCKPAEIPVGYNATLLPEDAFSYKISGLTSGESYAIRVSAVNAAGVGQPSLALCTPNSAAYCRESPYLTVPQQRPGAPEGVLVEVQPGVSSELAVSYQPPHSDGGASILAYRIDWSADPDFASSSSVEVSCPSNAARQVVFISTIAQNGSSSIVGGTFSLQVQHAGVTALSLPIRFDATASMSDEEPGQGSGVFCDPSAPHEPCDQSAVANPGSMQSHLQYLSNVHSVSVSRAGTNGEHVWAVTFNDAGGDWHVSIVDNSLENSSGSVGSSGVAIHTDVKVQGEDPSSLHCLGTQTIRGLTQGLPYFVRVSAYNMLGYGPVRNAVNPAGLPAQAPMRAPGRPTGAALSVVSGSQLGVTWSPPTDTGGDAVTEYLVQYSTDPSFSSAVEESRLLYVVDGGPYFKHISGLMMGTMYYVRILAKNSQGYSSPQRPTPPYEFPRQAPSAPMSVSAGVTSQNMITVAFTPPLSTGGDAVTHFRVDWDTDRDFEGLMSLPHRGSAVVSAADEASYTITDLSPGTEYYIRVQAGNSVGFGPSTRSMPLSLSPSLQLPGAPGGLTVTSNVSHPSVACGGQVLVEVAAPVIPAHGLPCSGGGSSSPDAGACPAGLGVGTQADGGARIIAYEVQWSAFPDFRDTSTDGGNALLPVPVGANSNGPHTLLLPSAGAEAPMVQGKEYFFRVAARTRAGTGPFCGQEGQRCDGDAVSATPSAAC